MKFKEIVVRITGLSVPVFGVQWSPKEPEVTAARRVIGYLEDRRVLYNPSEMESPDHCVQSVLQIRSYLTQEIGSHGEGDFGATLKAMRAACRKFLNCVDRADGAIVRFGAERGHWASWAFNGALGELRGVIGVHIAQLAVRYGLDVDGELASILPEGEDEGDQDRERRLPPRRRR